MPSEFSACCSYYIIDFRYHSCVADFFQCTQRTLVLEMMHVCWAYLKEDESVDRQEDSYKL